MPKKQKLYCYVDETGQDTSANYFIVVAIVSEQEQDRLKEKLITLENDTNVGRKKWHKTKSPDRENFLRATVKEKIAKGEIFYSQYKKPLPFFLPLLETSSKAIESVAQEPYNLVVYVDGIDKKKARELTNALRLKGVKTAYVRSARDESEPLIRLADRWVGCIRAALENRAEDKELIAQATNKNHLKLVWLSKHKKQNPHRWGLFCLDYLKVSLKPISA